MKVCKGDDSCVISGDFTITSIKCAGWTHVYLPSHWSVLSRQCVHLVYYYKIWPWLNTVNIACFISTDCTVQEETTQGTILLLVFIEVLQTSGNLDGHRLAGCQSIKHLRKIRKILSLHSSLLLSRYYQLWQTSWLMTFIIKQAHTHFSIKISYFEVCLQAKGLHTWGKTGLIKIEGILVTQGRKPFNDHTTSEIMERYGL